MVSQAAPCFSRWSPAGCSTTYLGKPRRKRLYRRTLTPREMEVLELAAQGKLNKEIAAILAISERTVKFHMHGVLMKLGADNRTEAVSFAIQRGSIRL